jgi:hypothetical protein
MLVTAMATDSSRVEVSWVTERRTQSGEEEGKVERKIGGQTLSQPGDQRT